MDDNETNTLVRKGYALLTDCAFQDLA